MVQGILKELQGRIGPPYPSLCSPPSALNDEEKERYVQIEEQLQTLDYRSLETLDKSERLREEQSKLGRPCVLFAHSYHEDCKKVFFHAQIIADFMTIEEIINKFCESFLSELNFLVNPVNPV